MDDDGWLEELSDDARMIWNDAEARALALADIARAWRLSDPNLDAFVGRVDSAVVEGLAALGFPRGPVRKVSVEEHHIGVFGQKLLDCTLRFSGPTLEFALVRSSYDRVFSSWIHESLHARQQYAPGSTEEYRRYQGFEEGFVERLTRYILDRANVASFPGAFSYFVAVYEQLASALGIEAIELWRRAWKYRAGDVGGGFVDIVDVLYQRKTGLQLSQRQQMRVRATASGLFSTIQDRDIFDPIEIRQQWEAALGGRTRVL